MEQMGFPPTLDKTNNNFMGRILRTLRTVYAEEKKQAQTTQLLEKAINKSEITAAKSC